MNDLTGGLLPLHLIVILYANSSSDSQHLYIVMNAIVYGTGANTGRLMQVARVLRRMGEGRERHGYSAMTDD